MRQRIGAVLEWAVTMELGADNPRDRILPVLGPQGDIVQHGRALPRAVLNNKNRAAFRRTD